MKKIKYILSFLLFFIGFSFVGESFMLYLDTFEENFSNTTVFKPAYISNDVMKEDIKQAAETNKVGFFVYKEVLTNSVKTDIYIYSNAKTREQLVKNHSISNQTYDSMLLGSATIHLEDFTTIQKMQDVDKLYLIGNKTDMTKFKAELVDKYGGNFPKLNTATNESKKNIFLVWIIIFIALLLLTYYDILFIRKEILVKVVFGDNLKTLILKNIVLDGLFFSICFVASGLFLSNFTNTAFHLFASMSLFGLFLLINSMLYLSLFFANVKEAFSNSKNERKLLYLNYLIKIVSIIVTITITSSCIGVISETISYYNQRDFFEKYEDYSYIKLNYLPQEDANLNISLLEKSANMREKFYQEYFKDSLQLVNLTFSDSRLNESTIMANRQAIPYLITQIPELKDFHFEDKIYYIFPEKQKNNHALQNKIRDINQEYTTTDNIPEENLTYTSDIEVMSIDGMNYFNRSKFLKNPVILLNNILPDITNLEINKRRGYYAYDIMYEISESKFQNFVENNQLNTELTEKTNVYDLYEYHWEFLKRSAIVAVVLLIFILFLEGIVIGLILHLEYKVNAMELSLKKIVGYSIWARNKKLILITTSATILSMIISLFLTIFFHIAEIRYVLYGGILVLGLELVFISLNVKKADNYDTIKVE